MLNSRKFFLLFLVILAAVMVFAVACNNPQQKQAPADQPTEQPEEKPAAEEDKDKADKTAEAPRRGCAACHVKAGEKDYSLLAEAVERTEAGGGNHPTTAPDGTKMDENTNAEVCLQCHSPGTNGRAKMAPLMLRAIVHPPHMGSETFKDKYKGSCFTCHEVDGTGRFNLLTEKVEVNEKGLPKQVPIPGMIPPSESAGT